MIHVVYTRHVCCVYDYSMHVLVWVFETLVLIWMAVFYTPSCPYMCAAWGIAMRLLVTLSINMGAHHPYHLDLCADDEDPSQLIIRPGWDAPHIRCFPRMFCAWSCLLTQVGTVLGSPYDYVVAGLAYANSGSRHTWYQSRTDCRIISLGRSRL